MIGQLTDGQKPRVEDFKGRVAIWAGNEPDVTGLVMSRAAAIDTGLACLALAAQQQGGPITIDGAMIEIDTAAKVSEAVAARLVITTEGAALAIELGALQFIELAAALAALAREIG